MQAVLIELFRRLVNDRIGRHAVKIVELMRSPEMTFPRPVFVTSGGVFYTFLLCVGGTPCRTRITSVIGPEGDKAGTDGPEVVALGKPADLSRLGQFRLAADIDRAWRGFNLKFDGEL